MYANDGNRHNGRSVFAVGEAYHETSKPPYDVVCPMLPGDYPNAYRQSCESRLISSKVMQCCRRCALGKEIAAELNIRAQKGKSVCSCGRKIKGDYQECFICRIEPNDYTKTCEYVSCDEKISSVKRYCEKHGDVVKKEKQRKRNQKKKLLREKEKIEKQLAGLE